MIEIDLNNLAGTALTAHLRTLDAPDETTVRVYRGATLVFLPKPLGEWKRITTEENDRTSVRFIKYRPFPAQRQAA